MPTRETGYLNVSEAARHLGVCRATIAKAITRGQIPALVLASRAYRIPVTGLNGVTLNGGGSRRHRGRSRRARRARMK